MGSIHRTAFEISFKHCDPAGIVFYPRYAEMVNDVVEHWFRHGLGCDFATLHGPRGLAIPAVNLTIDFKRPSHLGETVQARLGVERIGNSSMRLCILFHGDGADAAEVPRLVAHLAVVFVRMEDKTPVDIPPDLRRQAGRYLREPVGTGS